MIKYQNRDSEFCSPTMDSETTHLTHFSFNLFSSLINNPYQITVFHFSSSLPFHFLFRNGHLQRVLPTIRWCWLLDKSATGQNSFDYHVSQYVEFLIDKILIQRHHTQMCICRVLHLHLRSLPHTFPLDNSDKEGYEDVFHHVNYDIHSYLWPDIYADSNRDRGYCVEVWGSRVVGHNRRRSPESHFQHPSSHPSCHSALRRSPSHPRQRHQNLHMAQCHNGPDPISCSQTCF